MKKILAPLTALSIALGVSVLAAVPASADEPLQDDINTAIEAPAPFLKEGLTCAATPADIMLPASPVFSPSDGVTEAPLEYLAPVWTEAGFSVVVNVLPEFQRYYDVWANGVQVRAETVTFIIPACPPVVEAPPVTVEPVIPAPVVPAPPAVDPVVVAPVTPLVTPPAVQPQAPVEAAAVPAAATPVTELAYTGVEEDMALWGALALSAGLALLVLRRKLA